MDAIAEFIGLTAPELIQLLMLAAILVVGWFVVRLFLKLTAALFRVGCVGIILLVGAIYLATMLNGG